MKTSTQAMMSQSPTRNGPRRPVLARLATRIVVTLAMALTIQAPAFPPAPPHTLFGMVRDELGNPLLSQNAEITLETFSGVKIRTLVIPALKPGVNYELAVPMDAGLTADPYKPTALRPTVAFKLRVRIGSTEYLPIEMRGDYALLGAPAARTRLDLTLGEDSDGDGLPDAWERAILAAAGGTGSLADIRGDGDADGDGLTNLQEYLAGTYAFDPADGFVVSLVNAGAGSAQLEFLAIRGRSYRIETSTDLGRWQPVPFRLLLPVSESTSRTRFDAADVQTVRVTVPTAPTQAGIFRLVVE